MQWNMHNSKQTSNILGFVYYRWYELIIKLHWTLWCRSFCETLIVTQLAKKFQLLLDPDSSLVCSQEQSHWVSWIQSRSSHVSQRSTLILLSHLCLDLQTVLFPLCFLMIQLCICHFCCTYYMSYPSHPLWFNHPHIVKWRVHIMKLLIM